MQKDLSTCKYGKLIVIDGTDGSGKATQAKLLVKRLKKEGKKVKTVDFPRYYDNFFGKFIGECLVGMNGDFAKLDPKIASVLYAADRFESSKEMHKWLEEGCYVIADRYASSNQIHQGGKITEEKKRKEFLTWLDKMEFEIFKIPRPDAIIYLDVPLSISRKLMQKEDKNEKKRYQNGKKDLHETDPTHLLNAKKSAIKLIKKQNNWVKIDCTKNEELLSKEVIAEIVWSEVEKIS